MPTAVVRWSCCPGLAGLLVGGVLWVLLADQAQAQTVGDLAARGRCSTSGTERINRQLIRTHACLLPDSLVELSHRNVDLVSDRVYPFFSTEARERLLRVAESVPLQVTSAFRTVAQQFVLHASGRCGLAARPGRSNHETGRAIDVSNWSRALPAMTAEGCTHPHPDSDPVHFECGGPDMREGSVLSFQVLWNANHPADRIPMDGIWGRQTEARMRRAPVEGFDIDPCDDLIRRGAALVSQSVSGPDGLLLEPGEARDVFFDLRNVGTDTWSRETMLVTTEPRERASVFESPDWVTPSRPVAVVGEVPTGEVYRFLFTVTAPSSHGRYEEHFGLVASGSWFGDPGQGGPSDDALVLRLRVQPATVVDGSVPPMDGSVLDASLPLDSAVPSIDGGSVLVDASDRTVYGGCSGCSASRPRGGTGIVALGVMLGLLLLWRRRPQPS